MPVYCGCASRTSARRSQASLAVVLRQHGGAGQAELQLRGALDALAQLTAAVLRKIGQAGGVGADGGLPLAREALSTISAGSNGQQRKLR